MNNKAFPLDHYMATLVRLLDTIKYQDNNYDRAERVKNMHYVYTEAAKHFAQPLQLETLKMSPKKFDGILQCMVPLVVYCWAKVSPKVMVTLTIYYTYTLLLDDSSNDPHSEMTTFFEDLVLGRQPKNTWLRLVQNHLVDVLSHYGSFCAFNIVRSTFDFFQGCWIEHKFEDQKFQGFFGSHDFPPFLRRLNGLGHCVGATLFPSEQFDEQTLFNEITTAIAHMEHLVPFVNDLMSFYKEFDDVSDQTSLVINYCHVEGISMDQALDKLIRDTIHCCEQLTVFKGKDPNVEATIQAFVIGYLTWHMCDPRYRMNEVAERSGDSAVGVKFRHYYEEARRVGCIDPKEWAVPSVSAMVEQANASRRWNPSHLSHLVARAFSRFQSPDISSLSHH